MKNCFIWLNKSNNKPPKCPYTLFDSSCKDLPFYVAEFKKEYCFEKKVKSVHIQVTADVKFYLYVNGTFTGVGPVASGGDYFFNARLPFRYVNEYDVKVNDKKVMFFAEVLNKPDVLTDISYGENGFLLNADITFDDGETINVSTDETWLSRVSVKRRDYNITDTTFSENGWENASLCEKRDEELRISPIPMLSMTEVLPDAFTPFTVKPGEKVKVCYEYDKILSVYNLVKAKGEKYKISLEFFERTNKSGSEEIIAEGDTEFLGLRMCSIGHFVLSVENMGSTDVEVQKVGGLFVHYPIDQEGSFECSNDVFNKIYSMGKHALKICRQTLELDSPMHQEPLACAGDYLVSSLMNYYTYGDARLTRLDIVRIGEFLKVNKGYMFHTTYAMMWIMMAYDYYMHTGDDSLYYEIKEPIKTLLELMHTYTDEDGLITNAPNYLFVDWLNIDTYTLHHPPMALGQSVLNAVYYKGLMTASEIFAHINEKNEYKVRAEKLKNAINNRLYDKDRKLYFDGENTKYTPNDWLPENTDKRYFSWHTNSLMVLFDIAEKSEQVRIMEDILNDKSLIDPQPYFMHFVLEAIYKVGLFEKYGIDQLMRWECMTDFEKGLQEGWYSVSEYGFDYSHVWAGTPTYQLPSKISGIKIIEPGFKEISLNPSLYGLEYAKIKIPTPFGYISISGKKGEDFEIEVPEEIKYSIV